MLRASRSGENISEVSGRISLKNRIELTAGYTSSLVIDRLCDQARGQDIAVACLYYDYLAQQDQTITNVMGVILKQLVGRGGIPDNMREAFQEGKNEVGGRRLLLADLMRMLKATISSRSQVFICLDALDECLPKNLPELLHSLREIISKCHRTRIFLTGRPHVNENIQRYFTKAVLIPINPNPDDIRSYLEMRLDRDDEPEAMDNDLRADIAKIIPQNMSDMCVGAFTISSITDVYLLIIMCRFLLVSLNIDAILGEVTIGQRRKKLREMARGNGLSDAYTETLKRVKAQSGNKSVLGLKVLMWVLNSERPLHPDDLCYALGVEIGSVDQDPENVPALKILLSSCLGLVTVEASSSTVRLVHFTLQEHLSSDPSLFHCPHSTIAEVCLTYLNFGYVRGLSPDVDKAPPAIPFLDYASCYWGEHARREMTENVKVLALRLLDRFDEHISATLLLLHYTSDSIWKRDLSDKCGKGNFTALHGAALFGIVEIFTAVLEMKEWDINVGDCLGSTALTLAAERGHEGIVNILLGREDINPDQADINPGLTPLIWAADHGHEGVVKLLLEREDVNLNATDGEFGCTALSWAADNGRVGVVKIFLEREDVNPNQELPDSYQTLLFWAAKEGHEEVIKVLLERKDLNPNVVDWEFNGTLLDWAVSKRNEEVLKILFKRQDLNPNGSGNKETPLYLAARHGREWIVKMLLERENISPDYIDPELFDQTPLAVAAEHGHEGVVKILLERKDVNPDHEDIEYGQTPLSLAAEYGHEGVVKMLSKRKDVNPNHVDESYGKTPLSLAAGNGHEGVVKMLLRQENVNPDHADTDSGRTPLAFAAAKGHQGIVEMLLESKDVNPDQPDTFYGRTPLIWAAVNGNERVVKILLERECVDPNLGDTIYGRTPLAWAAKSGHERVVNMFLEREDVDPDRACAGSDPTLLSWWAEGGPGPLARLSLEIEGINPDHAGADHGRTPLSFAAEGGHVGIVKMLLGRKDGNPDHAEIIEGRTALSRATENGREGVVKMLLQRKGVDTAAEDKLSQAPL